jgi:histone H3/H4
MKVYMIIMDLPLAPVEKLLKKSNMRVSDEAVKEFANILEELITDVAAEAAAIANRNGRKTIILEDVIEARRKIK